MVEPDSALIAGDVTAVTFKGVHYEIIVDVSGFKWMIQSTEYRKVGDRIGLALTPNDIHVMQKSEYSGMYGDYSTFSDEMGEENASVEMRNSMEIRSSGEMRASTEAGAFAEREEEEGGADEI